MNGLLVRVGADQSEGGGYFNGPVNSRTGEFAYVPIPETADVQPGMSKSYSLLAPSLKPFQVLLPGTLAEGIMHLDPDFGQLTYGDQGQRARQIQDKLTMGDLIVFYAALRDIQPSTRLVYAIIGLYVIEAVLSATSVPTMRWDDEILIGGRTSCWL